MDLNRIITLGVIVGITTLIKDLFFPDINVSISVFITLLSVLIGYFLGVKLFPTKTTKV